MQKDEAKTMKNDTNPASELFTPTEIRRIMNCLIRFQKKSHFDHVHHSKETHDHSDSDEGDDNSEANDSGTEDGSSIAAEESPRNMQSQTKLLRRMRKLEKMLSSTLSSGTSKQK